MEAKVYNQEGKETGKVKLPESVFDLPWNNNLVHQVVVSQQANARQSVAHAKDRSEVRGGGRKPWRQKGTGNARHGSIRSPIWRGGGVTFGPRKEKNYSKKINKKMKAKALFTALSKKYKDNEIIFVDSIVFPEPKTKKAKEIITNLSKIKGFDTLRTKRNNAVLFSLGEKNKNTEMSFRNFGNVLVDEARNLDPVDLLTYKYLIVSQPENVVKFLEKKLGSKPVKKTPVKKEVKLAPKKTVKKTVKKPAVKKTTKTK
ncbi:MAG: 50S ribosomal protein L4 [Candidatus Pacebacteria bacterium]|jgi:large subunit ribosomal protein L4|nr:50S ribosomal protein L4 [Parcubacteria group bacterium]MDP6249683.1 50S ribosomal protein L4 [Candidatus Paceibacterota bacterium]MDP7159352.1 50S ribosomal protein L4 [Candidatus Paceibacterota bacterium]MDP7368408.1 50S ribosomal protein L4 [Candidatus Paceibacterota bacterium]MDP7466357.1 50S ribosomal protein L4 [Candidatus Paceibacterota bacterium]|tara:strand:- start:9590 stop:10363 length:774 start_codon:yes stop_codon:yes gene_type:complete